jgi:hypothetical protein
LRKLGWWDTLSRLRWWHDHVLVKPKMAKMWSKLCWQVVLAILRVWTF